MMTILKSVNICCRGDCIKSHTREKCGIIKIFLGRFLSNIYLLNFYCCLDCTILKYF